MIIPFLGISFLALSFVLYFKQADPINFFIQTLVSIFSGIIYPVSVLPPFMQNISDFIPLTLQLNSARSILINNSIDNYIFSTLFFTHIFFSILFLFACMQVFKITIFLSKEKGTIGNY
jgi:ABC-2 type transport system permease protein